MMKLIKRTCPEFLVKLYHYLRYNIFDGYSTRSYSQEGEDVVLWHLLQGVSKGFYVDVGAHHPKRFSTTYLFYKHGWHGINIDAMPGSMKLFNKMRPRDINLEFPISDGKKNLTYFMFNDSALNSFSSELSEQRDGMHGYKIISKKELATSTLEEVLDKYLPCNIKIDFLSTDAEGLDIQVLKSNNWKKYRPDYILVEILQNATNELRNSEEYRFLTSNDYALIANTGRTAFFRSKY